MYPYPNASSQQSQVIENTDFSPSPTFQTRTAWEFIEGSAIAPELFRAATEFHADNEQLPGGDIETPIHDALGWHYRRFGAKPRDPMEAVFVVNEDGTPWQLKLSTPRQEKPKGSGEEAKPIKYETPKGAGATPYLPPLPPEIRAKIAARYGVDVPMEGSFWDWVPQHPELQIIVTEGAKKALALLSQGYIAIALYGANGGYRSQDGKRWIAPALLPYVENREIILAFDQDVKPTAIKRVTVALARFGALITQAGGNVAVATWDSSQGKGVDDLIVAGGIEAWETVLATAQPLKTWKAKSYSKLSYSPALTINAQYLPALLPILQSHGNPLIGIKSPKGTGKTEQLIAIVEDAMHRGQRVILLSHRVQLAQAICDRVGLPYVTEVRTSQEGNLLGYGLCVDSLHPNSQARFNAEEWKGALVIIDEVEQVLWHALSAHTQVQKVRPIVLAQLAQLLSNTLNHGGRVIALDADLSDISLDLIKGLAGWDQDPWILLNSHAPLPWQIHNYTDTTPIGLMGALGQRIKAGERVFILTQSQKAKGKYSTQAIEAWAGTIAPGVKILRIDSETVSNPNHPAYGCISRLNEVLQGYDIVICSPSIETGVDISLKGHFSSVWAILQGVNGENSARQFLARLRDPVDRHVWIAPYGLGTVAKGGLSVKEVLDSLRANTKEQLHLLNIDPWEDEASFNNAPLVAYAKFAARNNAGMMQYRATVIDNLKGEGHTVTDIVAGVDRALNETLTAIRDEIHQQHCEAVAGEADLSSSQYQKLDQKKALTQEERNAKTKYETRQRYGMGVTPDLVALDDSGLYPKLRLLYFLGLGREHLPERDQVKAQDLIDHAGGQLPWLPDFTGALWGLKVKALEVLGIPELLKDADRVFRNTDQDLIDLAEKCCQCRGHIKRIFGVTIAPGMGAIQVLRSLLATIGRGLDKAGRDSTGKNTVGARRYTLSALGDLPTAILQSWKGRDDAKAGATPQAA